MMVAIVPNSQCGEKKKNRLLWLIVSKDPQTICCPLQSQEGNYVFILKKSLFDLHKLVLKPQAETRFLNAELSTFNWEIHILLYQYIFLQQSPVVHYYPIYQKEAMNNSTDKYKSELKPSVRSIMLVPINLFGSHDNFTEKPLTDTLH